MQSPCPHPLEHCCKYSDDSVCSVIVARMFQFVGGEKGVLKDFFFFFSSSFLNIQQLKKKGGEKDK